MLSEIQFDAIAPEAMPSGASYSYVPAEYIQLKYDTGKKPQLVVDFQAWAYHLAGALLESDEPDMALAVRQATAAWHPISKNSELLLNIPLAGIK